uniref:C2H2-type domain-containing protein n=1 Tax=Musca domestica TaxID=7370 RepID=A0A1I8MPL4_MUSDO
MRILRSQYLQLQGNLHQSTTTTTTTTNGGTIRPTNKQRQQQQNTTHTFPSCVTNNSYNLRNLPRGKNNNCFNKSNSSKHNEHNACHYTTVSGYSLRQTQNRNQRVGNVTRNVMVTRSIAQRTTSVYRQNRKVSVSSTESYDSTTSSEPQSSSSTSSSHTSASTKLSSSDSHGTASSSSRALTQSSLISNVPSSGYETLQRSNKQQIAQKECINKAITQANFQHLHIKFSNVPAGIGKINVNVEFTDISPQWLTTVYNSYENNFWYKIPRNDVQSKSRWFFLCKFCEKMLASFLSLKNHLNTHLELYPYKCKLCSKAYTGRNGITKHLRSLHNIPTEKYNVFIGQ